MLPHDVILKEIRLGTEQHSCGVVPVTPDCVPLPAYLLPAMSTSDGAIFESPHFESEGVSVDGGGGDDVGDVADVGKAVFLFHVCEHSTLARLHDVVADTLSGRGRDVLAKVLGRGQGGGERRPKRNPD